MSEKAPTNESISKTTITSASKEEVLIVDVFVKAVKSTPHTQYYYIDRRYRVPTDEPIEVRHNITLLWMSGLPGFYEAQLVNGKTVRILRDELRVERKEVTVVTNEEPQEQS